MKKLFMFAAAAALAIGVSSCDKPGDGPGKGDGEGTLASITISLPQGSGMTRQTPTTTPGTPGESSVQSLDVFIFNDDAGKTTPTPPYDHASWAGADFTTAFGTPDANGKYTSTVAFPTNAGAVRIWAAINLPADFYPNGGFANEQAMLDEFETLANLTNNGTIDATHGLVMFSDAKLATLAAVAPNIEDPAELPAGNIITVDVYRAVAKMTTSAPAAAAPIPIQWTADTESGITPTLTYSLKHWFVFQTAMSSYTAPNYSVASWVTGSATAPAPGTRPKTRAPGAQSANIYPTASPAGSLQNVYAYLSTYKDDGVTTAKLRFNPGTTAGNTISTGSTVAPAVNPNSKYVGENAPALTTYGTGTFVFFSTTVTVNAAVKWDGNVVEGGIVWETITGDYGHAETNKDIYYIRYNGKNYVTDTQAKVDLIMKNTAEKDWRVILSANPALETPVDGFTFMTAAEFQAEYGFETFIYYDGYVHFQWFVDNETADNAHDVLRNQFIHLNITGINATASKDIILGYPGQTPGQYYPGPVAAINQDSSPNEGSSDTPIDPSQVDNNPYRRDPNEPVDPTQTALAVNVIVNPWTYVLEGIDIK